jgi:uncharacterized membrane protein HdeD (DUF308 family)
MSTTYPFDPSSGPGTFITQSGRWLTAIGIVFLVLGVLAIIEPSVAGLAAAILVGWLLVFASVVHAVEAFSGGGVGPVVRQLLLAVIFFIGGMYFLTQPLIGLGTLTLFLAAILLVEAIVEFVAYFRTTAEGGSGWRLVNAIVTALLAGMIWSNWPSSSAWAIGTLVGVDLIMTGISRLMLGSAARRLATSV